jgi:flagellar hook-associated protein 1 FlgK
MSTFSGINTALSSLIAQRQALEVAGQNIANASTVGYTRQRANLTSIEALSVPSMYATLAAAGNGTSVSGISRLGDAFLDARLRTETGASAYLATRADSFSKIEATVGEPGATGLSSQLSQMWSAWGDVSNSPDSASARAVLMQTSQAVVDRLGTMYTAAATEWSQSRTDATSLVSEVNATASSIADLNSRILSIANSGGSANELMDQRDQLVTSLSGLTGATARTRDNGVVDVLIGGNAIVDGAMSHGLTITSRSCGPRTPPCRSP